MGDRHVYGATSRFLTRAVRRCFEEVSWSNDNGKEETRPMGLPVDVAAKLRGMWA